MVFKGVLYRNDTSVYTWVQDITKMKPLEYFKNFAKVSVPRYDLPWFIDYSGKIWQAFCNAPYDYWDQKQLNCVPSTSCHVDTVVDAPTKTCIYNQVFGFTQISTVTNALEISAQGSYLIILKADFSLWKWDTTTSTFISLTSPATKTLRKITITEKGIIYACTTDFLLYQYVFSTSLWSQIVLSAPLTCIRPAIGYGPQSRLTMMSGNSPAIFNVSGARKDEGYYCYFYKEFDTWVIYGQRTTALTSNVYNQGYGILNYNKNYYFEKYINSTYRQSQLTILNEETVDFERADISSPDLNIVYMVFNGGIYRQNEGIDLGEELYKTRYMNIDMLASRISNPYKQLPWIIGNGGKIYKAFCNFQMTFLIKSHIIVLDQQIVRVILL